MGCLSSPSISVLEVLGVLRIMDKGMISPGEGVGKKMLEMGEAKLDE